MKNYISTIILSIAAIFLVGCSSNINNYENFVNTFIEDEDLSPLDSIDSLKAVNLFVLNDQHIGLITQNNKSYLLTTPDNCKNMYSAKKIILLSEDKAMVKVNNGKVARVGDKYTECTITGMYKLHSVQLDLLYSAYQSSFRNPQGAVNGSSSYPRGI
ncbi:DUF6491 family protein [uncultured Paraglaciecola sp.]|uniref:DUF6491 family protein n=1 Tax=uncultured Paraglaciecola sp. TaxID=1765024 RepID=UPI0030DB6D6C|tara:strand:+ start:32246 stop:32719 length:474 start_codon:yes stop_codon:yes gene_type:complete